MEHHAEHDAGNTVPDMPAVVVLTLAVVPTAVIVAALVSWLVTRRQSARTRDTHPETQPRALHHPPRRQWRTGEHRGQYGPPLRRPAHNPA
ncbi:hypothetical protein SEA_ALLEYCAT_98 [Mycobacterium phage AlleyCat]|uniref:Uncharacterized protein n=2 Tax=Kratiovirus larva TaxID=1056831 RepID=A0A221J7C5_9CAUD|nr:hypothetical protein SEA_ALLEYCAT_98 [Mycobacterium phage AlleyCat]QQV92703.1 hypothetical protein SEA_PSYCHO_96 [Mycobacterium phage Psycho]WAB09779.1 membrane protein [Mycobacterium phage Dadosky]